MKQILIILSVVILSGCAVSQKMGAEYKPEVAANKLQKEFDTLPAPDGKKVTVAVYGFADKTGQRKPTPGIASLSTAVTQGGEVFLIKALQDVGRGTWFDVVERVNIDALTKERTIIRQMREAYEGKDAKPLMPLMFAGIIMDGGIIGYDSGTESGGAAYRFLGIGPQTQYSKDTVTVSLRAVSVNTGKVLAAITVTKIVYSTADSVAVLKYIDNRNIPSQIFGGAENVLSLTGSMFEAESGLTINEPGTLAIKATVEAAVVELIKEGEKKGVWDFKKDTPLVVQAPTVSEPVKVAPTVEVKKEEPKPVVATPAKEEKVVIVEPKVIEEKKVDKPLFGQRKLKEDLYIQAEPTVQSTKKWWFKKGTVVDVRELGSEGWLRVRDRELRGGWVREEQLDKL
jgi:curli production assembly/transport component CsgG